jgi:hypothetical protein
MVSAVSNLNTFGTSDADFVRMRDSEDEDDVNAKSSLALRTSGIFACYATLANTLLGVSIVGTAFGFAQAGYFLGGCCKVSNWTFPYHLSLMRCYLQKLTVNLIL